MDNKLIFIINDFDYGSFIIKAEEILDMLFKHNHWLFTSNTPNLKSIGADSHVLVYMAGKKRRIFVASFEIAGDAQPNELVGENDTEKKLFKMFSLAAPIKNASRFEKPLPIANIKNNLDFISDKKNWGLFFRQSTKIIGERDFQFILDHCAAATN